MRTDIQIQPDKNLTNEMSPDSDDCTIEPFLSSLHSLPDDSDSSEKSTKRSTDQDDPVLCNDSLNTVVSSSEKSVFDSKLDSIFISCEVQEKIYCVDLIELIKLLLS